VVVLGDFAGGDFEKHLDVVDAALALGSLFLSGMRLFSMLAALDATTSSFFFFLPVSSSSSSASSINVTAIRNGRAFAGNFPRT